MKSNHHWRNHQSAGPLPDGGFALLEVLISMAVVAFALLNAANLTTRALQMNQATQFRTQAILLSSDILERMETNNSAAFGNAYKVAAGETVVAPKDCSSTLCKPADLAKFDLAHWKQDIAEQLPGGKGEITAQTKTLDFGQVISYTVKISWQDRRSETVPGTPTGDKPIAYYVAQKAVYNRAAM